MLNLLADLLLRLLPFLLRRADDKRAVRIPLRLDDPQEWTDLDRETLAAFLNAPTGRKLKDLMVHEMYAQAITGKLRNDFDQGRQAGMNTAYGTIIALALDDSEQR